MAPLQHADRAGVSSHSLAASFPNGGLDTQAVINEFLGGDCSVVALWAYVFPNDACYQNLFFL